MNIETLKCIRTFTNMLRTHTYCEHLLPIFCIPRCYLRIKFVLENARGLYKRKITENDINGIEKSLICKLNTLINYQHAYKIFIIIHIHFSLLIVLSVMYTGVIYDVIIITLNLLQVFCK